MADIHANRRGVEALNRVFDAYSDKVTTQRVALPLRGQTPLQSRDLPLRGQTP